MATETPAPPASRRKRTGGEGQCAAADTRELILEVAERLFAERGFASVSIRDITAEAGVNIASINYYFGSKDKLLFEVFKRRVNELTDARLAALEDAKVRTNGRPSVRDIVYALLSPSIRWRDPASGKSAGMKFLQRARAEGTPEIKRTIDTRLGALEQFRDALLEADPRLSFDDVCWGMHFALSSMHYAGMDMKRMAALSQGRCEIEGGEPLIDRIVDFAAAGIVGGAAPRP